jgi:molecular chaperone DnaJ
MNLKEAYATLELAEGASPEEAKKKYRELTKKWHPDVNKDPAADAKFKKINEAYECVKNGKGNDREPPARYGQQQQGWPFNRQQQQVVQLEHVEIKLTIDFKESVLGCKKEVKYGRKAKCPDCDGAGEIRLNNGCTRCGGKGQTTVQQRGMIFISTCPLCGGRASTEDCKTCNAEGTAHTDVSVHVSVPAGVVDGNTLRLQGMGNYAGTVMGIMDQYTDAYCHITVKPEPGLSIDGRNVVFSLTLPLLDAIRGCKQNVKTIFGNKEIRVPPQSRNRDEVIIPHCGVGGTGDQKVILDVQYPKNTDKLIGVLIDEVI